MPFTIFNLSSMLMRPSPRIDLGPVKFPETRFGKFNPDKQDPSVEITSEQPTIQEVT
jgi:hypothetical protein